MRTASLSSLFAVLCLAACGEPAATSPESLDLSTAPARLVLQVPETLVLGETVPLQATVLGTTGQRLAVPVTWHTTTGSVMSVTADGMLSAIGAGADGVVRGEVVAEAGTLRTVVSVGIRGRIHMSSSRGLTQATAFVGDTFTVSSQLAAALPLPALPIAWAADPGGVVSLTPEGTCSPACGAARVVAAAPGTATVTFRYGAATAQYVIVVRAAAETTPLARLEIDRFTVTRSPTAPDGAGRNMDFFPRLSLREVDGVAGAVVTNILFRLEGIGAYGTVPNWEVWKPVPAGGTAEMIQDRYGEPEFWITGYLADTLSVRVVYRDQNGRRGELTARTAVTVSGSP